ncbi:MBL fold metallo-hydrolase [Phenylobacterium montanum]|uniref:MBL fold metallo-hydrolase n=1 Tax=Phenylobacterium montanum TaxID=2823693 RepID=A0A975FYS0_9CAUL|nr:MBL fold metallo-hydrolase [Caulobacter sp. S6]QUD87943.1 MBL fold metallo-hydrolase [Caulobacter sp. S6]
MVNPVLQRGHSVGLAMVLAAGLGLAAPVLADAPAAPGPLTDAFIRYTLPVTDRVHVIYRTWTSTEPPFEGNSVVFEQSDGLVVVDAGGSPLSGRHIVEQIKGFSGKPVKYLIYTHWHGDHDLGAGAFREAWPGVRIISTAATREAMTGPPMAYIATYSQDNGGVAAIAQQRLADPAVSERRKAGWRKLQAALPSMVGAYKGLKAWPADITFTDRLSLPDAETPIDVLFLGRANTEGDAVVWAPKQRVLAAGDIVVSPVPYAGSSFPAEWIGVLNKLKAYDFAYLVPGHGRVETDRAYLDKLTGAIQAVRDQVGPLAAKGLSLEEVRKQTDFTALQTVFGGDDDWDRAQTRGFFIEALVSNAYKEARGEPIIQGRDGG